jgi:prepilin-type N-terminal cleavage/methylation domain-containing protein
MMLHNNPSKSQRQLQGMTLVEVVMAVAIVAIVFGGTINAYIQASKQVEWSGYSMAAQSLAQETIEQARAAMWDPAQSPPINEVTNLNVLSPSITYSNNGTYIWTGYLTNILDVPYSGTNYTVATNFVTVQMVYLDGYTNVMAQFIRVDCVWPFNYRSSPICFTNTVCTMMAPDNRDPNSL